MGARGRPRTSQLLCKERGNDRVAEQVRTGSNRSRSAASTLCMVGGDSATVGVHGECWQGLAGKGTRIDTCGSFDFPLHVSTHFLHPTKFASGASSISSERRAWNPCPDCSSAGNTARQALK